MFVAWQGFKLEAPSEDQVWRLTSQWNGRLRAAHSGAVHRRVRRHMTKPRASGSIRIMKVATGIVVDGKVVVEGTALAEGSTVTVMLRESDDTFTLRPEDENELLESIAAIERGEFVSGEELLERLRRFG